MYGVRVGDMEDGNANPYLAQIPLTVSPFVSLPTATTLPYTYKSIPSSMPPSATGEDPSDPNPKYVVSQSGHAANPNDIIASCEALQAHIKKTQEDAEAALKKWQGNIKDRELAEKRRVAPGWLDREEKILEPQRKDKAKSAENVMDMQDAGPPGQSLAEQRDAMGEAMDKAFG